MASEVFFWALPDGPDAPLAPADPRPGLRALVAALSAQGTASARPRLALKVHLGAPGRPAAIAPAWASTVAGALTGSGGERTPREAFATDTLSIGTRGLDEARSLAAIAAAKGYGRVKGCGTVAAEGPGSPLRFVVGDDPAGPGAIAVPGSPVQVPAGHSLAGILGSVDGLCLLNPVRPHPHLGVVGAVSTLGLDLVDRDARLRLHRNIRPQVDTPLCAGCGSCLDVCLYDAIAIRGGRAFIDHQRCTGCGECMGVCFMAGIAPEGAAGLAAFQDVVAASALLTMTHLRQVGANPLLHFNFLVQLDTHATAAKARRRLPLAGIGILASRDPVAVDAAAFDLLSGRLEEGLNQWSGFDQAPGPLLDQAEALGLGSREYRMRDV